MQIIKLELSEDDRVDDGNQLTLHTILMCVFILKYYDPTRHSMEYYGSRLDGIRQTATTLRR